MIDVQIDQANPVAIALGQCNRLGQTVCQQSPVWQPGQAVMFGHEAHLGGSGFGGFGQRLCLHAGHHQALVGFHQLGTGDQRHFVFDEVRIFTCLHGYFTQAHRQFAGCQHGFAHGDRGVPLVLIICIRGLGMAGCQIVGHGVGSRRFVLIADVRLGRPLSRPS